jgi:4'-phosphopantetheinyl transferase
MRLTSTIGCKSLVQEWAHQELQRDLISHAVDGQELRRALARAKDDDVRGAEALTSSPFARKADVSRGIPRLGRHNPHVEAFVATSVDLENESHIWLAWPDQIDDPATLDAFRALLSETETARMARFRFDVHRKLYLVSHALVRTALSNYADLQPGEWLFSEEEFGRPEIAPACKTPALRFNLSHTEGLSAIIVTKNRDCGVDVEGVNHVKNLAGIAERVFTEAEQADLFARSGDDQRGRFADYWTLKEAYMKARGLGFQLPPQTFGVEIEAGTGGSATLKLATDFKDDAAGWQLSLQPISNFAPTSLTNNFRLAVAVRAAEQESHRVVVRNAFASQTPRVT